MESLLLFFAVVLVGLTILSGVMFLAGVWDQDPFTAHLCFFAPPPPSMPSSHTGMR